MGLVGRRDAISAPTVGNVTASPPVSTARPGPSLSWGATGTSPVTKSSKRASAMSATHITHADHANRAAVWRLIPPIFRFRILASFVTTITLPHYLLPAKSETLLSFNLYTTRLVSLSRPRFRNAGHAQVLGPDLALTKSHAAIAPWLPRQNPPASG